MFFVSMVITCLLIFHTAGLNEVKPKTTSSAHQTFHTAGLNEVKPKTTSSAHQTFHTADGNIGLTTTHQRINALNTKNFILNCTYEAKNSKVLSLQLAKVIKTGTSTGVSNTFVSMDAKSKLHILSPSPDVKYTGGIRGKGKAYLSGTWHRVPKGLGGTYRCEANVIDSVGHIEYVNRQIHVLEEKTTFVHSVAAIKELQTFMEKMQTPEHKRQERKEWMALAFSFLERGTMKTFYSKVYKNKYYIAYHHAPRLVKYAEDYCQARGGYLAEMNDLNEWKFVNSFLATQVKKKYRFYVSGRRNFANNTFYLPRMGKGGHGYFKWIRGNPSNSDGNEYCVEVTGSYGWKANDVPCFNFYGIGFICEIPTGT